MPIEIYKRYGNILLPKLEVLNYCTAKEWGEKNQLNTASYRPISLLCSDVRILAKVLEGGLNRIISKCIHPDQSGFIPVRATSMNIRRAYLNLQLPTEREGTRAILSLDTFMAFDSLEWHYLWQVLAEFGPNFVKWIRILYRAPRAKVRINVKCSQLVRGTRQGCPLLPLLFALALEPLALAIRSSSNIQGFRRATGEETVALNADDVLLFLGE